jgi:uncharacterized protein (DUF1501 family)
MNRRELIRLAALGGPLVCAGRAFAAPQSAGASQPRLLVIFLRGAYDATSLLVPVSSDFYYESRPTIAIARPDPADPAAAIPLTADWGLHPALAPSILPLWHARQVAFVPFAGTDDLSRSHFETQDNIELGQPTKGSHPYASGFMGRLAATMGGQVQPIAFTQQVPLIFRDEGREARPIPNIAIGGVGKPGVDARQAAMIQRMYQGSALGQSVAEGFAVDDAVYRSISGEMAAAGRGAISAKGFELSARRVGRLMRDQFNLAFLDVGGWDTHVGQGAANGYLAARLGELGRGLAGYVEEIGPDAWRRTVVVVVSEFGRTFRENGDKGTDHGHGSVYWVTGGSVRGGRIAGDHGPVTREQLNQDRDYPVLVGYRDMLGGLFRRIWSLDAARGAAVFPSATPRDLALV